MTVTDIADIAGANAVVKLSDKTTITAFRQMYVATLSGNARLGKASTVSATRGVQIGTAVTIWRPESDVTSRYDPVDVGFYVPSGVTVTITLIT